MKPPYAIRSVPGLSGHAIAYRWRSLPRVRRHRASKPQGSFERVLPWQITMDQLISASLSHTHYWYEVGMLRVPANGRRTKRKIGDGVFASQPHASTAAIVKPPPPPPGVRETEAWSPKRFGFCRRGDATLLFLRQPLFLENSVVFPHSGVYAHHAGPQLFFSRASSCPSSQNKPIAHSVPSKEARKALTPPGTSRNVSSLPYTLGLRGCGTDAAAARLRLTPSSSMYVLVLFGSPPHCLTTIGMEVELLFSRAPPLY